MDDTPYRSLYDDGWDEANRHKWLQSEIAGRDLGEAAICHWVRQHWHGYLRARWLEHLQGRCFWIELSRADFGVLKRELPDDLDEQLLAEIVTRLAAGQENLEILIWAADQPFPPGIVLRILTLIDINSSRVLSQIGHDIAERASPSTALVRAERILTDGHRPGDLLPIPADLSAAAERELATRPVPPTEFWASLLTTVLRHHHAGQQVVTKRLPKGVIVLAVGSDEVAAFLAHFPAGRRVGTTVENC